MDVNVVISTEITSSTSDGYALQVMSIVIHISNVLVWSYFCWF